MAARRRAPRPAITSRLGYRRGALGSALSPPLAYSAATLAPAAYGASSAATLAPAAYGASSAVALAPAVRKGGPASARRRAGRGRHRRLSAWDRLLAWAGFGRAAWRQRELFEAQVRELRRETALLRAEASVLRHELELAKMLAEQRAAEAARLTLLLPLVRGAFAAAAARERIHLDYSPDVRHLLPAARSDVIDLDAGRGPSEIVLPVVAAASTGSPVAVEPAVRRTA